MEVNAIPPPLPVAAAGPLRVELKLGNGRCPAKGCVEGEQQRSRPSLNGVTVFTIASFMLKLYDNLLAEDAAYSSFYSSEDYPITKVLREPIYIQVNIMDRSDPNIILNLEHCWATSNPSPHSMPQWDLLVDGYKHNLNYLKCCLYFVLNIGSHWLQVSLL